MTPFSEVAGCSVFSDSLGGLFLLASSILPGSQEAAEEILVGAHSRWRQRPEEEWTLLNAQRDVALEALQRSTTKAPEVVAPSDAGPELPAEAASVANLPFLERVVFLMGTICHFGVEEISKLLRIPAAEIRLARINAFRLLPKSRKRESTLQTSVLHALTA